MSVNIDFISKLKDHVVESAGNSNFIHHEWFVDFHLKFVERISLELCDRHQEADKDLVLALVWIHDYAKILDKEKEHDNRMLEKAKVKMLELGFESEFVTKAIDYLSIFEKKLEIDLHFAPIEVQIVSSADAASHLIGPFWSLYFKENNTKSLADLLKASQTKLKADWDRKMVLPEVRAAFKDRHNLVGEQYGNFPEKFL